MSCTEFQRTQRQFYFAVDFFSRPMSALLMRMPCPEQRLGILANIVEEHGGFQPSAFHEATFRDFLVTLGVGGKTSALSRLRMRVQFASGKGASYQKCEAPEGPFRLLHLPPFAGQPQNQALTKD